MDVDSLGELYKNAVLGTPKGALVSIERICICTAIYISSKCLKHIYDRHCFDKKAPKDFDLILENLTEVLTHPDKVFINKPGGRGDLLFAKEIDEKICLCVLEIQTKDKILEVVSASFSGEKYLRKFTLLWSEGTANSLS